MKFHLSNVQFEPFQSQITVVPDAVPDKHGSIVKPEVVVEKSSSGVVDKVGPSAPEWVRRGMRVAFAPYSGNILNVDGENIFVMLPSEILGVLEDEDAAG